MQKVLTLFQRNHASDRLVNTAVVSGAEWVLAGVGVATRKFDGTSCLYRDGMLWKRYDAKQGRQPPADFEPAEPHPDPQTGHWPGWVPVTANDSWHLEALARGTDSTGHQFVDGATYELCGPKIQGNPEHMMRHELHRHGSVVLPNFPRTYEAMKATLLAGTIEGVVWHHPDGRMVKIKKRDFTRGDHDRR